MNVVNDGPTRERPKGCQVINQERKGRFVVSEGVKEQRAWSQPANGTRIQQENL